MHWRALEQSEQIFSVLEIHNFFKSLNSLKEKLRQSVWKNTYDKCNRKNWHRGRQAKERTQSTNKKQSSILCRQPDIITASEVNQQPGDPTMASKYNTTEKYIIPDKPYHHLSHALDYWGRIPDTLVEAILEFYCLWFSVFPISINTTGSI